MNEVALKGMLKMVKNFVSPDQVKGAAMMLIQSGIDYKNKIELNPDNDEQEAAALLFEQDETVYFSIAVFNSVNEVVRQEHTETLETLIDKFLKNL